MNWSTDLCLKTEIIIFVIFFLRALIILMYFRYNFDKIVDRYLKKRNIDAIV